MNKDTPELLLRDTVFEDFNEYAVHLYVTDMIQYLANQEAVWWNAYSLEYGREVKPFPFDARNGFFVDMQSRMATHRFLSGGIARRDMIPNEEKYLNIVPDEYRKTWFDPQDARRCYSILITDIQPIVPIEVEEFGLFQSWGRISSKDRLQRPRLIKPKFPFKLL